MRPCPGEKDHVGVTPAIRFPAASLATALKRTTSPCRARGRAGVISIDAIVFATTCTGTLAVAEPALAEIVARPGATAVTIPSAVTRATAGALLLHPMVSSRTSPSAEWLDAPRRRRCPTTSAPGVGAISTRAAGPGSIFTSTRSITGFAPGTRPTTLTGSVPVEPANTSPSGVTSPSKEPPAGM
jgi:hypothetical protein